MVPLGIGHNPLLLKKMQRKQQFKIEMNETVFFLVNVSTVTTRVSSAWFTNLDIQQKQYTAAV